MLRWRWGKSQFQRVVYVGNLIIFLIIFVECVFLSWASFSGYSSRWIADEWKMLVAFVMTAIYAYHANRRQVAQYRPTILLRTKDTRRIHSHRGY
jgi:hypothetical protein